MIVVCGDSFMAPDPNAPGRHFSELIGAVSLAKPGCSNTEICFQIEEAIAMRANKIIIGTTDPSRTELKLTDQNIDSVTLKNFRNQDYVSDTISSLIGTQFELGKKNYQISQTKRDAVKIYFTEIFDTVLKRTVDEWALGYWYKKLEEAGINYYILPRNFCIYSYALNLFEQYHKHEPYTFHTDFITQEKAAILLLQQ